MIHKNSLRITAIDALALIKREANFVIFDVRSAVSQSQNGWKISPSKEFNFTELEKNLASLDPLSWIFFYCA